MTLTTLTERVTAAECADEARWVIDTDWPAFVDDSGENSEAMAARVLAVVGPDATRRVAERGSFADAVGVGDELAGRLAFAVASAMIQDDEWETPARRLMVYAAGLSGAEVWRVPAEWASALVNGDYSGLEWEAEKDRVPASWVAACEAFATRGECIDACEDPDYAGAVLVVVDTD